MALHRRTRLSEMAKDALYVTVGLGVLTVQKAQVRRQELQQAARRPPRGPGEDDRGTAREPCAPRRRLTRSHRAAAAPPSAAGVHRGPRSIPPRSGASGLAAPTLAFGSS